MTERARAIQQHAVDQFRKRGGANEKRDDLWCIERMFRLLATATPMQLKPKHRVAQLLRHDFREAEYYHGGGFMFVVESGVVKTVHTADSGMWEEKH